MGVLRSNPCFCAKASSILFVQVSFVVLLDQGNIPPSSMVRLGLYREDISISLRVPRPAHSVHAPSGELNENDAGVILGYEISH